MSLSMLPKPRQTAEAALAVELGRRIRAARQARGLSQAELGQPLTRAYVSQVESGRTLPSLPALLHLADRLGVEPCALLPSRATGQTQYTRAHDTARTLDRAPSG